MIASALTILTCNTKLVNAPSTNPVHPRCCSFPLFLLPELAGIHTADAVVEAAMKDRRTCCWLCLSTCPYLIQGCHG
jgi:hypothetical protein